jgi:Ribonuclease G/E
LKARILASCSPGEIRVAIVEDAALLDYALYRPGSPDGVGDLYLARITAVLPALGGAFVQIGQETGFLPDKDAAPGTSEGTLLPVRVTRSAQGGKGPRLTALLSDAERERVARHDGTQGLIARGPDPLRRFAAARPDAPVLCDDLSVAAGLHSTLGERVRTVQSAFEDAIESAVESLARPDIALPGGLRASIHPTPALVAIDMDGAGTSAERRPKQSVQFAANSAALPALLHQIRLRNLSGAILLDLAGLASRKRSALGPDIEAALARDPLRPRLLGFTALGFAEIQRPRIHPPLHELLHSPLGAGLAALRAALAACGPAHAPRSPAIRGSIAVVAALQADPGALSAFAQRAAVPISLRMDPTLPELSWTIENV